MSYHAIGTVTKKMPSYGQNLITVSTKLFLKNKTAHLFIIRLNNRQGHCLAMFSYHKNVKNRNIKMKPFKLQHTIISQITSNVSISNTYAVFLLLL
jgi:hypothetical protein